MRCLEESDRYRAHQFRERTPWRDLVPGNAPAPIAKRTPESILRDQFAALVEDRYDHLQVIATVALGKRGADALLPALRTFVPASSATTSEAVVDSTNTPVKPEMPVA